MNKSASARGANLRLIFYPLILFLFFVGTNKFNDLSEYIGFLESPYHYNITPNEIYQENFDVRNYQIDLKFENLDKYENPLLFGAVKIQFTATENNLNNILLNFSSHLTVDSVSEGYSFDHDRNVIAIEFDKNLQAGETEEILIYYSGWPRSYLDDRFGFLRYTPEYSGCLLSTINLPFAAQTWFPCKDKSDDRADGFKISVTVPDSLTAVSNGRLIEEKQLYNNLKKFTWEESYPIATYQIGLNIGTYEKYSHEFKNYNDLQNYHIYTTEIDTPSIQFVMTQFKYISNYLSKKLGVYPFKASDYKIIYDEVLPNWSMQNLTFTNAFTSRNQNLLFKLFAKQWFGALLAPGHFKDYWILEGLAAFYTGEFIKQTYGPENSHYYLKSHKYHLSTKLIQENITHPDSLLYQPRMDKALWFFHMLADKTGQPQFDDCISQILTDHKYATVSSKLLLETFSRKADFDVYLFYRQWALQAVIPAPRINATFLYKTTNKENKYKIHFVEKKELVDRFYYEIELLFRGDHEERINTFLISDAEESFEIVLPFEIKEIFIDPNQKILVNGEWFL